MKVKFGIRIKLLILFLIFMLVLSGAIVYVTEENYEATIIEKYYDHAVSIAKLSASVLDGDKITSYVKKGKKTKKYKADLERLNNIKEQADVYYLYVMYPENKNEGVYVFDTALTEEQILLIGEKEATLGDKVVFADDFPSGLEVLETKEASKHLDITTTKQGEIQQTLASAYAPILNSKNEVVAFVGVDVNMTDVDNYVENASMHMMKVMIGITCSCFLLLLLIIQISILSPIKKLNRAAENLADGKYDERIKINGKDEIGATTEVFNRMSQNIKGHVDEINSINEAYHKYVPSQFFGLLKKESVKELQLGNQKQRELAVLDFNIVDFDRQIRQMNSEKMFAFINEILQEVLPDVAENQGMVETFHEGGFTSLYLRTCEEALNSAISICQKMNVFNQLKEHKVLGEVEYSMGIAYGSVMLGIVGHDSRMAAISISHQTELAEFLQKLAPKYYSHILITGTVATQIPHFFERYHMRVIGYIWNTFTGQLEKIYDVYDGDETESKSKKDMTKSVFEQGINYYCVKKFYEARNCFIEVLKQFRKDSAAREYLFLCNQYYQMEDVEDIDIYIEKF